MPLCSTFHQPSFLPVPSAVLTFRSPAAGPCRFLVGWVGLVCSSPALLSVSVRCREGDLSGAMAGEPFTLDLPEDELLPFLHGAGLQQLEDWPGMGGLPAFHAGRMAKARPMADFPVHIECICRSADYHFGQMRLCGEIEVVQIDGIRHPPAGPVDLCRLNPFDRRRLHRYDGGSPATGPQP